MSDTECGHCGQTPDADGDHTCPCPHPDGACPHHPGRHSVLTTVGLGVSGATVRSTLEVSDLRELRGPCSGYRLGWACTLWAGHSGPCPLRPTWWNRTKAAGTVRARG